MNDFVKRIFIILLGLSILLFALFFPAFPWAARSRHTLKKMMVNAEMKWAGWRGNTPRLASMAGKANAAGLQVQALDSRSGWASVTDGEDKFVIPDLMWYPGAAYELVVSDGDNKAKLIKVIAPDSLLDDGVFNVGELNFNQGREVDLDEMHGVNSITYRDYDSANGQYYKELFNELTAGKSSDEDRINAISNYVATKLDYEATQWEPGSPLRVLESGSQYCGLLSEAMATLLAAGDYPVRTVDIRDANNPPGTHVVVEVLYEGVWHLYDPTYGVKFLKKDGSVESYRGVRLDTSVINESIFSKSKPRNRGEIVALLLGVYGSGYHHFNYFKNK